jgi:hypothetical protein
MLLSIQNLGMKASNSMSLLAQLAERGTVNPEAVGSIPTQRVFAHQRRRRFARCTTFSCYYNTRERYHSLTAIITHLLDSYT